MTRESVYLNNYRDKLLCNETRLVALVKFGSKLEMHTKDRNYLP